MVEHNEGHRLHDWGGPLRWDRWPRAAPASGEVLVEVEACGVGRTVLNYARGDIWNDPALLPRAPGHEVVGRVVAVGGGVTSPVIGERVLAYFYLSCFVCPPCRRGREERCERLAGRYGVHRDGGYARWTMLPAGNAIRLPPDMDAAEATVVADAVATPVHVCRTRLGLADGDRIAVIGAGGGVGIHLVQVARLCGAQVAGLERGAAKLSLVESHGGHPVDSTEFADADLPWPGGRADAVVDLVGSPESLRWGLDQLDHGGRLCVLTNSRGIDLPVGPRELVARELTIVGSHYASRDEVREAARLVAAGEVRPVLGGVVPAPDVEELHRAIRLGTLLGRGALVW